MRDPHGSVRAYVEERRRRDVTARSTGPMGTEERLAAEALVVDVEGFEGPLDLLLSLARTQKVDLRHVSILQLAEQYLIFVEAAKRLRIELAADYLVMAAWLAYLKSRLLLPPEPTAEGPSAVDLAARLAWRLERLGAMRQAGARLMARDQLARDFHARGAPEHVATVRRVVYDASLIDLLRAYARIKTRDDYQPLHLRRAEMLTPEMALERLRGLIGEVMDWRTLQTFLPPEWRDDPKRRRSATAATFVALLELVRRGEADMRQECEFGEITVRSRRVARDGSS